MQPFSSLLQKRKAGNVKEHLSPKKKKTNEINVIVKKMNPYTLGVYFENPDATTPYYWPLLKALNDEDDWVKRLKIGMSVRRRIENGSATEIIKHTKKTYLDWHIFVRFLDEKELKNIDNIGETWGKDITGAMNQYFSNECRDNPEQKNFGPQKKYVFSGVEADVVNLSIEVVQQDVVQIARVLFKDAILSKELFAMMELCQLLFPAVRNPEGLFPEIM